jgi:hypothetical protein
MRWFVPLLIGCQGPVLEGSVDPTSCDPDFDDHTVQGAVTQAELEALSFDRNANGDFQVKFLITLLMDPEHRAVRFQESDFYTFHDEWYWFRLLNGESACGATTDPVRGLTFEDVPAIYAWAEEQDELPLDLEWVLGRRLYSDSFYALVLRTDPRAYSTGRLHYRAETDDYRLDVGTWDRPTDPEWGAIRAALGGVLPRPLND